MGFCQSQENGQSNFESVQCLPFNEDSLDTPEGTSIIQLQKILSFLKNRQKELDRRESDFNAQIAYFESEMRQANQIIQSTKEQLQIQKTELEQQFEEFESQKQEFQHTKQLFYEQSKRVLNELTAKNKDNIVV